MGRWVLGMVVAGVTCAVFWPAFSLDFIDFDDPVTLGTPAVQALDWDHLVAMATEVGPNWHPLTWLSHAIDLELFGREPRGHHAVSVVGHAINAWLAFELFWLLLGQVAARGGGVGSRFGSRERLAAAALGALVFALHPQRVESVAWISERKDVLCTGFSLLAVIAYLRSVAASGAAATRWTLVSITAFAAALASKSMAVSVPVTLLLLDVYPLGRIQCAADLRRRVVALMPLWAMALAVGLLAIFAQAEGDAVASVDGLGLGARFLNSVVHAAAYAVTFLWPVNVAPFHPLEVNPHWLSPEFGVASAGLLGLGALAWVAWIRNERAPAIAGLHFLVSIAPLLGIIQVGTQGTAERYTYFPLLLASGLVGALPVVGWQRWPGAAPRALLGGISLLVLLALGTATRAYIPIWNSERALWDRVAEVYPERLPRIHHLRGMIARKEGRLEDALRAFDRARSLAPSLELERSVALVYLERAERSDSGDDGDYAAARAEIDRWLEREPEAADAFALLGRIHDKQGELAAARQALERSLALRDNPGVRGRYAGVLLRLGLAASATEQLEWAIRSAPQRYDLITSLGRVHYAAGRREQGVELYQRALALNPEFLAAQISLAEAELASGNVAGARGWYRRAARTAPRDPRVVRGLAATRSAESRAPGTR